MSTSRALAIIVSSLVACSGPTSDDEALRLSDDPQASAQTRGSSSSSSSGEGMTPARGAPLDGGVADAGARDGAADAADAGRPQTPCSAAGPGVHAFVDATAAWRYATSATSPGTTFSSRGLAFRLAPTLTAEPHATLYLLASAKHADFLLSTVDTEGAADGYVSLGALGNVYLTQLPGTVPLTRYYQVTPRLRHLVSIDGPVAGWDPEAPRGYVCPR